jgi:hypothetical protein
MKLPDFHIYGHVDTFFCEAPIQISWGCNSVAEHLPSTRTWVQHPAMKKKNNKISPLKNPES